MLVKESIHQLFSKMFALLINQPAYRVDHFEPYPNHPQLLSSRILLVQWQWAMRSVRARCLQTTGCETATVAIWMSGLCIQVTECYSYTILCITSYNYGRMHRPIFIYILYHACLKMKWLSHATALQNIWTVARSKTYIYTDCSIYS